MVKADEEITAERVLSNRDPAVHSPATWEKARAGALGLPPANVLTRVVEGRRAPFLTPAVP